VENIDAEISIIQKNLKGVRNLQVRRKAVFILACLKSTNVSLTADKYAYSRQNFYRWLNILRENNYDVYALKNKSTAPKSNPRAISKEIIELAVKVRGEEGFNAKTVSQLLRDEHKLNVHASTLGYNFHRLGLLKNRKKSKKNKHNKRYSAENPLDRTQTDRTGLKVVNNHGNKLHAYPVIDDCSRVVTVHIADEHSGNEATKAMEKFIEQVGVPLVSQTDWGSEYTYQHLSFPDPVSQRQAKVSEFDQLLEGYSIRHYLIKPGTPQLNGKVERFNQTLKRHLKSKIYDGMTTQQVQQIVDEYVIGYNQKRVHASLNGLTPHQKFYGPNIARKVS